MNRPLRLQFAGAVYHVTSRGDRQQLIFHDDKDRYAWLDMLAQVCARFNFTVHSFCLMGNHYHLLIETGDANLATGMRQLNGQYSRYFNRRHQRAGHVFQGRYVAILVQKESHLRELARYVVLNPLRANMVSRLEAWPWSSYALMIQPVAPPSWLRTDWILGQFGTNRANAIAAYRQFVAAGRGLASPIESVRHQLLLGDDDFVARHRTALPSALPGEVKREQRRSMALSLAEYQAKFADRDQAIAAAYFSTAYTMTAIAQHFQVHYRTVSRIVQRMAPQQSGSCAIVRPDTGFETGV
ncbi:addiction module toxin RelE [Duganella sp. FT94W]|uniref:Addiction module toxin RelE n=1 Tax=Duganella lactea TaxID=2692173 RepID=A0ABW9VBV6_9BURK|nr:transposase [Duganella lactea]MYM35117.1 addiction module toxin RelE [Duganella lactea]